MRRPGRRRVEVRHGHARRHARRQRSRVVGDSGRRGGRRLWRRVCRPPQPVRLQLLDLLLRQGPAQIRHRPAGLEQNRRRAFRADEQELPFWRPPIAVSSAGTSVEPAADFRPREHALCPAPSAGGRRATSPRSTSPCSRDRPGSGSPAPCRPRRRGPASGSSGSASSPAAAPSADEAEDLIHVRQRPEVGSTGLSAHPGDQLREHERDDELALLVREVCEVHDRAARASPPASGGASPGRAAAPGPRPRTTARRRARSASGRAPSAPPAGRTCRPRTRRASAPVASAPTRSASRARGPAPPATHSRPGWPVERARGWKVDLLRSRPAEQARHGALDLVTERLGVGFPGERRRPQRPDHVQRDARCGSRRVGHEVCCSAQCCNALRADPARLEAFFQTTAVFAAKSSSERPSLRASSSFTHGRKLAADSSGNASMRLPMSPFGSSTRQGTPASSASSSRTTARPVFPGARHADDGSVRGQVAGLEREPVGRRLTGLRVEDETEVRVRHGADYDTSPRRPEGPRGLDAAILSRRSSGCQLARAAKRNG